MGTGGGGGAGMVEVTVWRYGQTGYLLDFLEPEFTGAVGKLY
jgi:hypothetical protein